MVNVSLYDVMEFEHADRISLQCSDPSLPTDSKNLAFRAAELLQKTSGYQGGAKIALTKTNSRGRRHGWRLERRSVHLDIIK